MEQYTFLPGVLATVVVEFARVAFCAWYASEMERRPRDEKRRYVVDESLVFLLVKECFRLCHIPKTEPNTT